jgi:hypothetical protein
MPAPAQRAIALLFLGAMFLIGPCLLALDAVLTVREAIFIRTSSATEGTVVGLRQVRSRRGGRSYAPVFRFTAGNGEEYTVASNTSTRPTGFTIGQRVRVLYESVHPERAKIDSFSQLWFAEIITGILGGAFSIIPALVFLRRVRPRPA